MQQKQVELSRLQEDRRVARTRLCKQADRLELLISATDAEDVCPLWFAERLSDHERLSS